MSGRTGPTSASSTSPTTAPARSRRPSATGNWPCAYCATEPGERIALGESRPADGEGRACVAEQIHVERGGAPRGDGVTTRPHRSLSRLDESGRGDLNPRPP